MDIISYQHQHQLNNYGFQHQSNNNCMNINHNQNKQIFLIICGNNSNATNASINGHNNLICSQNVPNVSNVQHENNIYNQQHSMSNINEISMNNNYAQLVTEGNNCYKFQPNQIAQPTLHQYHAKSNTNSILSPLFIHHQPSKPSPSHVDRKHLVIMNGANPRSNQILSPASMTPIPSASSVSYVTIPVNTNLNNDRMQYNVPNMQSKRTNINNSHNDRVTFTQSAFINNIQYPHNVNVNVSNNKNMVENNPLSLSLPLNIQNLPKVQNMQKIKMNNGKHFVNVNHSKQSNYKCDECNKIFSRQSNLIQHKRIHSGERPYVCKWCNKSFTQKHSLTNHVRIHTGERPFKCDICHKRFNVKYNLKTHRRIHTGEKPYSCQLCNKHFTSRSGLNSHTKHIHREKTHQNLNLNMKMK